MANQQDARGHNDSVRFFFGFLVGTVIGVALGALLAPKSGSELRADVRDAAERGAEALRKAKAARFGESEPDGNA
jgi:gas vesicle protein